MSKPKQEPEVRLVSATWEPGPEGHRFNKKSTLKIKAEFLKETFRKKVTCDLFVVYDNAEENLSHQVEAFLDPQGNATAQMTLYYGEAYNKALRENPAATCRYKAKIKHPTAVGELESELLEMPHVEKLKVDFIEVADVHFHHNCALPCLDESGELIAKLGSVFSFASANADRELVVDGHADRSGDNTYNLTISKRRAEAIKGLLQNDAALWNGVVNSNKADHTIETEDYQQTLKSLSVKYAWPCNPGAVARTAILAKAQAWVDRIDAARNTAMDKWLVDSGIPHNSIVGIRYYHPKYSITADTNTSQWNLYGAGTPAWLRVTTFSGNYTNVDPDKIWVNGGHWGGLSVGNGIFSVPKYVTGVIVKVVSHEAGHATKSFFMRDDFGPSLDHSASNAGIMYFDTSGGNNFTDREKKILRGVVP